MVDFVVTPTPQPASLIPLEQVEREHILSVLKHFEGNKTKSAKTLKIGIRTLQRKLKKYEQEGL